MTLEPLVNFTESFLALFLLPAARGRIDLLPFEAPGIAHQAPIGVWAGDGGGPRGGPVV